MKRIQVGLGGIALMLAALTMSFSMAKDDVKSADELNDCWSSFQRYEMGLPPDRSSDDCVQLDLGCCFKPDPNNPGQYLVFSMN